MHKEFDDDEEELDCEEEVVENEAAAEGSCEGGTIRVKLPNPRKKEMFGIADQLLGGGRIKVVCEDGKVRMGRIRGKMKKRLWIRAGDLIIVKPWEFQDEKADIVWRYTNIQSMNLSRNKKLPASIDIFS